MSKAMDPAVCAWCETGRVKGGRCQNALCGAIYGHQVNRRRRPRLVNDIEFSRSETARLRSAHEEKRRAA